METVLKEKLLIGYAACGPTYRESAYKQLKEHYFDDDNIYYYILTDDKSYFSDLKRKNLIVKELKDYYEEFPKLEINESFLESDSKTDFATKSVQLDWKFPFSVYRFALHQAIELNITNVALLCTDTNIQFDILPIDFFDDKDKFYCAVSEWDAHIWNEGMQFVAQRLEKEYNMIPDSKVRVLDAAGRILVAKDLDQMKLFFKLWNEIIEWLYESNLIYPHFSKWYAINDEYILAPIYNVMGFNKRSSHQCFGVLNVKHNAEYERFWRHVVPGIECDVNYEKYLEKNSLPDITLIKEEAPVEEAPVEEAPVEEAPVEEAPVEEAPILTPDGPMANISYHGSHNGGLVIEKGGEIICVLEFERFFNAKNVGMTQYKCPRHIMTSLKEVLSWVEREYGISEYNNCYFSSADFVAEDWDRTHFLISTHKYIKANNYEHSLHHESHAYSSFYQSPFKESLIFSFDAGGDDGKFNVYHAKRGEEIVLLKQFKTVDINPNHPDPNCYLDFGYPYFIFGAYLKDIDFCDLGWGNLVWPGKIMGLISYGNYRPEWKEAFRDFYLSAPDGMNNDYLEKVKALSDKIGVKLDHLDRIDGQLAYDLAATSQRVFEDCFIEVAQPFFDQYPDLPVCITGGCGLNIVLNNRIKTEFNKEVFVGPLPNDSGIALGGLLKRLKPEEPVDITYKGIPILDKNTLGSTLQEYPNVKILMDRVDDFHPDEQIDPSVLVKDLSDGKIVGVVQGNAECGPRALGHRSILCNPSIAEMKDILNHKVKHREWYRPFAPVVRLEDVSKYFEWDGESRWMSFCPTVKEEWRTKLAAITHVDNTARVQTVTKEQNEWLYNLLTDFEKETGVGVLLNTSFNVNGKPILSTYGDAFKIYNETELDCLVLENLYIRKEPFNK